MVQGHGGQRPGAGRKQGKPKRATADLRTRYERILAREARELWRINNAHKRKRDRSPEPSKDDAEAALELNVRNLLRHAVKDPRVAMHLDERLCGRIPYSLGGGEDGDAPTLPAVLIPAGIYQAQFDDGKGALGFTRPAPPGGTGDGKK
jgi:hypothetical protein